jgi:hypothetical protein
MKRLILSPPAALILLLGTALTVLLYNMWSYCCGRCSLLTFFILGPAGFALAGANILAFGTLLHLRRRRRSTTKNCRCGCGIRLARGWMYCPECGRPAC